MTHCKKTSSTLYARRLMLLEMKKMAAELNEHRYYLEQKVAQSTEYLQKRIALLESCNATLCEKLTQTREALAALKVEPAPAEAIGDTVTRLKLYVMNPPVEADECAEPHVEAA